MKIIINAVSAKIGGAVTYITQLLPHLGRMDKDNEILVFLPPETIALLANLPENVHIVPTLVGYAPWWRRLWWEQITLRGIIRKERPSFLFSTANFGVLWCRRVPQLLLVRNALYFSKRYEQMFVTRYPLSLRVGFWLRRWLVCRSAVSADIVMTPTKAMLDDLKQFIQLPRHKTFINPYGYNGAPTGLGIEGSLDVVGRSGAKNPVRLLYVSFYSSEHKNLTTLLKAMGQLSMTHPGGFNLTTTVNPRCEMARWNITTEEDLELAEQADIRSSLTLIGPLSYSETQGLYGQAEVFVFPSTVESFGFPLVEAMAHGLPIVVVDTPVNREVCQDAAVYFAPFSPEGLASQIRRVAADTTLRAQLAAIGRQRVADHFQWGGHARGILKAMLETTKWTAGSPAFD